MTRFPAPPGLEDQSSSAETRAGMRSETYAALASGFLYPTWVSDFHRLDSLVRCFGRAEWALGAIREGLPFRELTCSLRTCVDRVQEALDMEVEYNRLFVGPGPPAAPPYESVYRDPSGLVMGQAAQDAQGRYADAGLTVIPGRCELPDHIATELGFMAYLAAQESLATDRERATWVEMQYSFLVDHLNAWVRLFRYRMDGATRHPFYASLAELTAGYVQVDVESPRLAPREKRS